MTNRTTVVQSDLRYILVVGLLSLAAAIGCAPSAQHTVKNAASDIAWAPVAYNEELTIKSRQALVQKLQALAAFGGFALGHQDTTAYGVGWAGDADRSDVADVCGSHVAVYGWDMFRLERGDRKNGDGVSFSHLQRLIRNAHALGGINTISWHVDNPLTGGDAWDTTPAIAAALPNGVSHRQFVAYLDRIADYLDALRGQDDERLPLILRLFHEQTGDWFWWGRQNSQEDYRALFEFTVRYLRENRGLDHLLIAFSPDGSRVLAREDLLYGYPGDELVDVIGLDYYLDPGPDRLLELTDWLVDAAKLHQKIPVISEFGPRDGLHRVGVEDDFLSRRIIGPLLSSDSGRLLAYVLAWRNARADHAFLPYRGHPGAADLKKVCALTEVLLTEDMEDAAFVGP